jgi:DNA repair protein RecO (recombination protein O)
VSGRDDELVYVSPKSGRAVSRQAGEPWKHRLLALPAFLREACTGDPSSQDIADGFALTGFFLLRHALEPRGLGFADARGNFIAALSRNGPDAMAVG